MKKCKNDGTEATDENPVVFSWASVNLQSFALSTAEAEYASVAAEETFRAIWLRIVLKDFREMQLDATPFMCEINSAITKTKNHVFHQKTKHIKRKFHFIVEALLENTMDLLYCKSEDQTADIFSKTLPKHKFVLS